MKWCVNIKANAYLAFAVISSLVICSSVPTFGGDDHDKGSVAGNSALQQYGSKEGMRQNLAAPMTNSNTQMKTIDGNSTFSAALGVPSTKQFLQIMIQPSGTGDLSTVLVSQDLNSDGTFDNSFSLGGPVSGVCANGFISCQPGTWNACQPYVWTSDDTGKVSFNPVGVTQLAGCYCINSSCGSNLVWTNSAIVLKDLGGGVVGAIHAKDASVMITNVSTDITTISYYGQLLKSATSGKSDVAALAAIPSIPQQQAYYGNWSQLSSDSASLPLTQASDPDSMYYRILNSSATQSGTETKKCVVLRSGTVTSVPSASYTYSGTSNLLTEHYIDMMISKLPDGKTYKLKLMDHFSGVNHFGTLGRADHEPMDVDGFHVLHTFELPPETGSFQAALTRALFSMRITGGAGCSVGSVVSIDGAVQGFNNRIPISGYCSAGGVQQPTFDWSYLFEYTTDTYQEGISNGCSAMEVDSTCRLQEEVVDTVRTVRNFGNTGLRPLPSRKTFTGVVAPMNVDRDWWRKDRTYVCDSDHSIDLSAAKQRYNTVVSSSADGGSSLTYSDTRQDSNGNWFTGPASITLPAREGFSECEQGCKVRRTKNDTQAGVNGVMSENRITSTSHDDIYKICIDGGTTCPVDAGETIVDNCKCVDQFAEAAVVMQTLRLAGADSVCSSGTPVPP